MKKHASSHGLAVLVCSITAGILIKICRDYYPAVARRIEKISRDIVTFFNIDYSPKTISTLLLAVILAVIWGCAFYLMHSDDKSTKR